MPALEQKDPLTQSICRPKEETSTGFMKLTSEKSNDKVDVRHN
jgi:hypothetical protein